MASSPRSQTPTAEQSTRDYEDSAVGARLRSLCEARIPVKPKGRKPTDQEIAAHLGLGLNTTQAILRDGLLEGRALYRIRVAFPDMDPDWLRTGRKKEPEDPESAVHARLAPSVRLSAEKSQGREPLPASVRRPPLPYAYVRPGDKR